MASSEHLQHHQEGEPDTAYLFRCFQGLRPYLSQSTQDRVLRELGYSPEVFRNPITHREG